MNSEISHPTNRNKLLALVSILSSLLLVAVIYIIILESQSDQTESSNTNLVADQQESKNPDLESSTTDNTQEATKSQKTTLTTAESRDPNRYYDDEDGYSFIIPEGLQAKPATEVYPKDSTIDFSHMVAISSEFPKSVKLGGSDWFPNASITAIDGHPNRTEKTESVKINDNTYEYYSTYSPDFDVTDYVYILKLSDREILISSFIKDVADKLVNSFQLL